MYVPKIIIIGCWLLLQVPEGDLHEFQDSKAAMKSIFARPGTPNA